MKHVIDLDFRPATYFRPRPLDRYLLSSVKSAVLRRQLETLYDAGRHDEVRALMSQKGFSTDGRKALERVHPMFMGGNYLPEPEVGQVEIARIEIKSTTYDVTSVYARAASGAIHYRVVDEYEGETLEGPTRARTKAPMTLATLVQYFLRAWPLMGVLERNFDANLEKALDFFRATSEFYPDLDALCRLRVIEHYSLAAALDLDEGQA